MTRHVTYSSTSNVLYFHMCSSCVPPWAQKRRKEKMGKESCFFFYLLSEIVVSKNVIFISATDRAETRTCL